MTDKQKAPATPATRRDEESERKMMRFTCYSCYEMFDADNGTTPCPKCGGNTLASGYDADLRRRFFATILTESVMEANAVSPACPVVMGKRSLWQSEAIELRDLLTPVFQRTPTLREANAPWKASYQAANRAAQRMDDALRSILSIAEHSGSSDEMTLVSIRNGCREALAESPTLRAPEVTREWIMEIDTILSRALGRVDDIPITDEEFPTDDAIGDVQRGIIEARRRLFNRRTPTGLHRND
jgi:hypothetical protein